VNPPSFVTSEQLISGAATDQQNYTCLKISMHCMQLEHL